MNVESLIKVAADNVAALRKSDVFRVLSESPFSLLQDVADHIRSHRPDLAVEVAEVLDEIYSTCPDRTGTDNGWGDDGQRLTWEGYDAD